GLDGKNVLDLAIAMPTGHYATTGSGTTYGWGSGGLVTGAIAPVPSLSKATKVSVAWQHACAVVSGKIVCWGDNAAGALGDGTTTAHGLPARVKADF
ncbi:MAG: RCC1 domain-containing protein, partial [Polyangiales bacterium]